MRLICLNIWHGKLLEQLLNFLKNKAPETDIFCFQEMIGSSDTNIENNVFASITEVLPGFQGFFRPAQDLKDGTEFGLAIFVKKNNPVDREGDFFIYRTRNAAVNEDGRTFGKNAQFIQFSKSGKKYSIINFHGLWANDEGQDTEDRIVQSKKLREFSNTLGGTKIICGDFNISPETESVKILGENMINLIGENAATSTRSKLFPVSNVVCDYIFVDKDLKVNDFKILQGEVSDHLALSLDFD